MYYFRETFTMSNFILFRPRHFCKNGYNVLALRINIIMIIKKQIQFEVYSFYIIYNNKHSAAKNTEIEIIQKSILYK